MKTILSIAKEVPMPEDLLKQKKRNLEREKIRVEGVLKQRKENRLKRKEYLKRAARYTRELHQSQEALEHQRQQALANGRFFVEPEAKLAFVVRIRGLKSVLPKAKKALQLLRLRQINNGVFVRLNKATLNMLKLVEPYVAWGYPSHETIRKLIYKRGHGKIGGDRIALTSNNLIEEKLGKFDIICVEDIIHQIHTVGPNFKEANNFLWPFKLSAPRGGYESIKKHFIQGGSFGNREVYINDLVARML